MSEKFFKGTINLDYESTNNAKRHGLVISGGKIYRDMAELNGSEIVVEEIDNGVYKFIAISPESIKGRYFLPEWLADFKPMSVDEVEDILPKTQMDSDEAILPIKNEITFDDGIVQLKFDEPFATKEEKEKPAPKEEERLKFIFEEDTPLVQKEEAREALNKADAPNTTKTKSTVDTPSSVKVQNTSDAHNIESTPNMVNPPSKVVTKNIANSTQAIDDKIYIATIRFPEFIFDINGDISFKDGSIITKKMKTLESATFEFYAVRGGFMLNDSSEPFFKKEWLINIKEGVNWRLYAKKRVNVFARNSKNDEYIVTTLCDYKSKQIDKFGVVNSVGVDFYKEVVLVTTKNLAQILKQSPYNKK